MTRFTFEYEGYERIPVRCESAEHGIPVSGAMWARYQSARMEYEACLRLMDEVAERYWRANPKGPAARYLTPMASVGLPRPTTTPMGVPSVIVRLS